ADAETPPFPDYGWGLWKVREDIEDWNESLRTLYVACTRAQDYLILSSALAPSFRPSSPWMLTLAERFDLFSGACLVPELPPERIPTVRVLRELAESDEVEAPPTRPARSVVPGGGTGYPAAIPGRRIGQRSFTVAELEASLHAPP